MRKFTIILVVLFQSVFVVAQTTEEAGIRENVQKYVAAFNAGDADAAAAVYAVDGTHTNVFGVTDRGRAEIARGLRELLAGPLKGARISITTDRVRFLTTALALEEETFTVEGAASEPKAPPQPIRGVCLAVHQQVEHQWLAAAVQCLIPLPAAAAEK